MEKNMGYIKGLFSKGKDLGTEEEDGKIVVRNRFKRFLKDKIRIKTIFSKFFILIGIAIIIGLVSFKYLKGERLKEGDGLFSKNTLKALQADKRFLVSIKTMRYKERLKKLKRARIRIGNKRFLVRTAANKAEWETGLMWIKKMGKKRGMLFEFGKPVNYGFWMKNTLIPLSVLFVGSNMKVNGAVNMRPCENYSGGGTFYRQRGLICPQYIPEKKYIYAIEINKEKGVSKYIGDKVHIGNK
jgi:uncharacterized membrane protein (UPF0127 family)